MQIIVELCNDIKGASHTDVRKFFAEYCEELDKDLNYIRRNEKRINENNMEDILKLNSIANQKKSFAAELGKIVEVVRGYDQQLRNID